MKILSGKFNIMDNGIFGKYQQIGKRYVERVVLIGNWVELGGEIFLSPQIFSK